MISVAVFMFGLAIGSFLNALVHRLENGESVLHGRSYCPQCKHLLAWYDLIPLLSFMLLKGRCRHCKEKISFQYPLVELATGIVFLAVFNVVGLSLLSYLWAVASAFIVIFVYDIKHYLIPDKILYSAIGLVLLYTIVGSWELGVENLISALVAGLAASAFFLAIYLLSKGKAMGFGDVKLTFLLGLFLGWPSILVALFFAFCIGAAVGLLLITLKKKGLKSEVPFAPFLIMGTAIAFFFGSQVTSWYVGLFLV